MKIIHCADLHIDSKMQTNLSSEKARTRRKEILMTFEKMIDYAKQNGVKAIIIAGDMFDTAKVTRKSKENIFSIIATNKNIDFYYLSGNHDEESIIHMENGELDNLFVFKEDWTTFEMGDISISGIKFNGKHKRVYDLLQLDQDKFNIVVMHGQISQYTSKSDSENINLLKLKNKNIDYLALGHIHSFDSGELDERGVWAYSGCMEGRGFDECGEKGFVLLDTENGKDKVKFIPFANRTLHEIQFDLTGFYDWFEIERKIIELLRNIKSNDLIKLVLTGKFDINLIKDVEHLEKRLQECFYYAKIKDDSTLEIRLQDFEKDMTLRGEFVRNVLSSSLKEEEKERVILVGLRALDGEELK